MRVNDATSSCSSFHCAMFKSRARERESEARVTLESNERRHNADRIERHRLCRARRRLLRELRDDERRQQRQSKVKGRTVETNCDECGRRQRASGERVACTNNVNCTTMT